MCLFIRRVIPMSVHFLHPTIHVKSIYRFVHLHLRLSIKLRKFYLTALIAYLVGHPVFRSFTDWSVHLFIYHLFTNLPTDAFGWLAR